MNNKPNYLTYLYIALIIISACFIGAGFQYSNAILGFGGFASTIMFISMFTIHTTNNDNKQTTKTDEEKSTNATYIP
jgi:uncharacterized membrane protein